MLYYLKVLMQVAVIFEYEASANIAPFELSFIFQRANDVPFYPPLPDMVVYMLSAHRETSEIMNNIGHLPHLGLFESFRKTNSASHELNQTVED
jgi:hypothetical protein